MNLRNTGNSWVGNIYHRFEAICQDVDGFLNKETVKYVENQVQSVGESVKEFYSDVVQDKLQPLEEDKLQPLGDDDTLDEKPVADKKFDSKDQVQSVTVTQVTPVCFSENKLLVEQGSYDTLRNSNSSLPSDCHESPITRLPCADPAQDVMTDLPLREHDDAVIWNGDAYNAIEDNYITGNLIPVTTNSSSTKKISETCDDHHKNLTLPMAASTTLSVPDPEILSYSDLLSDKDFLSTLPGDWFFEDELSVVKDGNSDDRSLSTPPVPSADEACEENSQVVNPSPSSGCGAGHRASNEGTLQDSFPTNGVSLEVSCNVQSTKQELPFSSCADEEVEMGVISSGCSTSLESMSGNESQKAENICSSQTESEYIGRICTNSMDNFPVMESNDMIAPRTRVSIPIVGSSKSRNEYFHEDGHPPSPSESGNSLESGVGIDELMETVDLSTDVKHDDRSLLLNFNFANRTSHGRKDFRYYKKLLQDAFTSRKRLSKEYEHLAILYSDVDMELRHNLEPSSLSSLPISSVNVERMRSLESYESEWELL